MTESILNSAYHAVPFYDEMFSSLTEPRPHYIVLHEYLQNMTVAMFKERHRVADTAFLYQGITFTV